MFCGAIRRVEEGIELSSGIYIFTAINALKCLMIEVIRNVVVLVVAECRVQNAPKPKGAPAGSSSTC